MVIEPAEECGKHACRDTRITVAIHARKRFLDFVDHDDTGSHCVDCS